MATIEKIISDDHL